MFIAWGVLVPGKLNLSGGKTAWNQKRLEALLPFVGWFPLSREQIRGDLVAAVSVTLLLIPQSIANAELAGLPPIFGLYASFVPILLGSMFTFNYHLATGPTAITGISTAAVLSQFSAPGTVEYIELAMFLALLIGVIRVLLGVLKFARIADIVAHPVMVGFTTAAALVISLSQVGALLGIQSTRQAEILGTIRESVALLDRLGDALPISVLFGLSALFVMLALNRLFPKLPSVMLTIIPLTIASYIVSYGATHGGDVVGLLPRGLPTPIVPFSPWRLDTALVMALRLLPGALTITLISFIEVMAITRIAPQKSEAQLNLNRELIGQGVAAIGGSFLQGVAVGGSFSRSAVNLYSGAKSGLSGAISAGLVVLVLQFLTPLFYHLPKAVLAAAIIASVSRLIDFNKIFRLFYTHRSCGVLATLTFIATLATAPLIHVGIGAGVLFSLLIHSSTRIVYRLKRPNLPQHGTLNVAVTSQHSGSGRVTLKLSGPLSFLTKGRLQERVAKLSSKRLVNLVVDGQGVPWVDSSGVNSLHQIVDQLGSNGVEVSLEGFHREALNSFANSGLLANVNTGSSTSTGATSSGATSTGATSSG